MIPHDGWRTTVAMFLRRIACHLDRHRSGLEVIDGYCRRCEEEE